MRNLLASAFVVLTTAVPAFAQDDKPVTMNLGAGWSVPVSGLKDSFNTGWNGGIGVTFNISPKVGIQGEYMYNRMGGPDRTIALSPTPIAPANGSGIIESNHQMHVGTFNLVFSPAGGRDSGPFGGYILAGAGIYHRMIQLTTPSVGYASVCDPYWLVCYPTLVSVDTIIGDRSSNDFGMNFGAGVTFGTEAKFYIESRYHYVWGPTITQQTPGVGSGTTGTSFSTNAQYFPITFGVRW